MCDAFTPSCCLDTGHAAFIAGYDEGFARGQRSASEDLAREWLHELTLEYATAATSLPPSVGGLAWDAWD